MKYNGYRCSRATALNLPTGQWPRRSVQVLDDDGRPSTDDGVSTPLEEADFTITVTLRFKVYVSRTTSSTAVLVWWLLIGQV